MNYVNVISQPLEEHISKEEQEAFVNATIAFYLAMQEKLQSGDPKKRLEAMQEISRVEAILEARKKALFTKAGFDSQQILLAKEHFEEPEVLSQAKEKLSQALRASRRHKLSKKNYIPV